MQLFGLVENAICQRIMGDYYANERALSCALDVERRMRNSRFISRSARTRAYG